jgi:hypothetical protein
MHADTREKGMVRCEKRISTEEEAAAGTRKGRRKGGAHRARERAQYPEMRENRTGTHQVSFRARAQQSTIHANRRSANLGLRGRAARRQGGWERRGAAAIAPAAGRALARARSCCMRCAWRWLQKRGGGRAREHTPLFRGDAPDAPGPIVRRSRPSEGPMAKAWPKGWPKGWPKA